MYPNGIAFDAQGRLYWTESMAHAVRRLDDDGQAVTFCQLGDDFVPDGMAFAADARAFVCTTISGGVTVISPEGEVLDQIDLGSHATNCIFDGPALYVTADQGARDPRRPADGHVLAGGHRRHRRPAPPAGRL